MYFHLHRQRPDKENETCIAKAESGERTILIMIELNLDLSAKYPQKVNQMSKEWFNIANKDRLKEKALKPVKPEVKLFSEKTHLIDS